MTNNKAENYCVRVTCNGEKGSGVIVAGKNSYYVFTAAHCFGEVKPSIDEIIIEKQTDYKSDFIRLSVIDIREYDYEKDFALLEIDFQGKVLPSYKFGYGFLSDTEVDFCGYQGINNDEYRPFSSKIVTTSDSSHCFKISLIGGDTFQQGGEDGQYIASGLSGSGVFIYRYKTPFLIGILNSVISEKAWNSDINCCSVHCIQDYCMDYIDLSDLKELRSWTENLDKSYTEFEIEAFKNTESDFFEKLYRKNKVLYPEIVKANSVTTKQIKKYLSMLNNIRQLDNEAPNLYIKFKEVVKRYVDLVEDDYTRVVPNSNEAIDKKDELRQRLKDDLDFLPGYTNIDFSDFQIIEWLGICTLNFVKND